MFDRKAKFPLDFKRYFFFFFFTNIPLALTYIGFHFFFLVCSSQTKIVNNIKSAFWSILYHHEVFTQWHFVSNLHKSPCHGPDCTPLASPPGMYRLGKITVLENSSEERRVEQNLVVLGQSSWFFFKLIYNWFAILSFRYTTFESHSIMSDSLWSHEL